jgi:hypothetical protein
MPTSSPTVATVKRKLIGKMVLAAAFIILFAAAVVFAILWARKSEIDKLLAKDMATVNTHNADSENHTYNQADDDIEAGMVSIDLSNDVATKKGGGNNDIVMAFAEIISVESSGDEKYTKKKCSRA